MKTVLVLPLAAALLSVPVLAEEDPAPHYQRGLAAEEARDYKTALAAYGRVLEIDEEHEDAFERWDYCHRLAEWQETVEDGIDAGDLVRLGEAFCELKRPEREAACYEEALDLDPDHAEAHGHLALLLYSTTSDFPRVYEHTLRFLRASPHRERLAGAVRDFEVYGALRNRRALLGDRLAEAVRLDRRGEWKKAVRSVEAAAADASLPEGARIWLWGRAGGMRREQGDDAGARRAFQRAAAMHDCVPRMDSLIALAVLDAKAGNLSAAIARLEQAVADGSGACRKIAKLREKSLKPLFTAEDDAIREAAVRLTDEEAGDAPVREALDAALARAGKEKKLVLLHWYGPYCPYVMAMEERLADPEVRKLLEERFVYFRVDHGSLHRAMTLDEEYGDVMRNHGIPSFFLLEPNGLVHSVQKDLALWETPRRSYSKQKIIDWLKSEKPEDDG